MSQRNSFSGWWKKIFEKKTSEESRGGQLFVTKEHCSCSFMFTIEFLDLFQLAFW